MTDQVPEPTAPVVVVNDDAPTLAQPAKAPAPRTGPKWETEARDRVKAAIKKFSKPLADGPTDPRACYVPVAGRQTQTRCPRNRAFEAQLFGRRRRQPAGSHSFAAVAERSC